ncbi:HNH endonuclease signature motif containing protein [Methylobacterium sp. SD21]|uniref:HNH endonuclease n=1 Tax=Methylobacterium litchii TaxID=3138810 RepID=UPI00313E23C7
MAMPFVVREDVGTTRRRSLSRHGRLKAWERTGGICVICDQPIDGVREPWIVEHIRALELGGSDEIENMGPAHDACGREKTRDDHARCARAKRQKIRHLGAAVVAKPLIGSRMSGLKRKIDGTVVRRNGSLHSGGEAVEHPRRGRDADGKWIYQGEEAHSPPTEQRVGGLEHIGRVCGTATMSGTAKSGTTPRVAKAEPLADDAATPGDLLPALPAHLDFVLEDRPLLPGENTERYEALMRSIVGELKPKDIIEAIWTKDIIDLIWEAKRLRRWRSLILVQADLAAAEDLIKPGLHNADPMGLLSFEGSSADALAAGWVTGSPAERDRVDRILEERGLTEEDVRAHGFLKNLPAIERIDRMIFTADQRRDSLFREIARKRASFAQHAKTVAADIIDAMDTGA